MQHISALIMDHNHTRVKMFNKITTAHNTLLLNRLISLHYNIDGFFYWGRNNNI